LESRRQRAAHERIRSLKHNAEASDSGNAGLPHIAQLITDGEITVGMLNPVGCVAVATDGHNSLAMLKRRPDETLAQLLTRLDQAIERAWTEEIYTDEINPPVSYAFQIASKRRARSR
jgi:hypothetical protein